VKGVGRCRGGGSTCGAAVRGRPRGRRAAAGAPVSTLSRPVKTLPQLARALRRGQVGLLGGLHERERGLQLAQRRVRGEQRAQVRARARAAHRAAQRGRGRRHLVRRRRVASRLAAGRALGYLRKARGTRQGGALLGMPLTVERAAEACTTLVRLTSLSRLCSEARSSACLPRAPHLVRRRRRRLLRRRR